MIVGDDELFSKIGQSQHCAICEQSQRKKQHTAVCLQLFGA